MLFDSERPEVVEIGEGPIAVLGDVDVDCVQPGPGLAIYQESSVGPRSSAISGATKKTSARTP